MNKMMRAQNRVERQTKYTDIYTDAREDILYTLEGYFDKEQQGLQEEYEETTNDFKKVFLSKHLQMLKRVQRDLEELL